MRTPTGSIEQTVKAWGNGLGVRITAPIAKAAHLSPGTPVKIEVVKNGLLVRTAGKPKLTLAQKLKAYDPQLHSGEISDGGRIGAEVF